jgi:hypothetical protein
MFGGINGIGRFLGLLASIIRRILQSRKRRKAQESYEAIESDPAAEFIDRYGVHENGSESKAPASQANAGKREKK